MANSRPEIREPDGVEAAEEASAGEARASGPAATREAMASEEPYRLSEEALDERDRRFTGPRKPQGPPLDDGDEGGAAAAADAADAEEVEETTPPEVAP